jgi:hypothetical protein
MMVDRNWNGTGYATKQHSELVLAEINNRDPATLGPKNA